MAAVFYFDEEGYRLVVQAIEKDEMDRLLLGDSYHYQPQHDQLEGGPIDHSALLEFAIYACVERCPELDVRGSLERGMERLLGTYEGLDVVSFLLHIEAQNHSRYGGSTPLRLDVAKWALRIRDVVRGRDDELKGFKETIIWRDDPGGLWEVLRYRSWSLEKLGFPGFFDAPTVPTWETY